MTAPTRFHYFCDLKLEFTGDQLSVTPQSRLLGPDTVLGNPRHKLTLLEETGHVFNQFDFHNWEQNREIHAFRFVTVLEDLQGTWLDFQEHEIHVERDEKAMHLFWGVNLAERRLLGKQYRRFSRRDLDSWEEARQFIDMLLMPEGPSSFSLPGHDEYVVQVYWAEVFSQAVLAQSNRQKDAVRARPRRAGTNEPVSGIEMHLRAGDDLWNNSGSLKTRGRRYQNASTSADSLGHLHALGTAYVTTEPDGTPVVKSSTYQNQLAWIQRTYRDWQSHSSGDKRKQLAALDAYLNLVPGDRDALTDLIGLYEQINRQDMALAVQRRFAPMLDPAFNRKLTKRINKHRQALLAKRDGFTHDPYIDMRILSHKSGDTVTRYNMLRFAVAGAPSVPLRIDCSLNGKVFAELDTIPKEVRFNTIGLQGTVSLQVQAWFYNRTTQTVSMDVNVMQVDEEVELYSTVLRTVARRKNHLLTDLNREDFRFEYKGKPLTPVRFEKSREPLRIAIVLDNSTSMQGRYVKSAREAIGAFLNNIEAEDQVELIAFGNTVLRLHPFSNNAERLRAPIYSMDARGRTSLYDALLVAHDDLQQVEGSRIMIVISDGLDTTSNTSFKALKSRLAKSDTMVYGIALGTRNHRLLELAMSTASIYTRLETVSDLKATMQRIYEELKAYYTIELQTTEKPKTKALKIDLIKGGKVRTRLLDG